MDDENGESKARIFWVSQVRDPDAPTAGELAAGVPLGEVVDDGLQFAKADGPPTPFLPKADRYKVIHNPDGSMDAIREDPNTITLVSEPDWIVFRPAGGVPVDALPRGVDGWWLDRRGLPTSGTMAHQNGAVLRFAPTGRFETRDGVVAEVFEVRP